MNDELLRIAEGLTLVAEGVRELAKYQNDADVVKAKNPQDEGIRQRPEDSDSKEQSQVSEQKISIEEIRAVLADKSQDGKIKEVRALLKQFGVAKLSSVEEKDYPELLQKAKVL
jgi:chromosome condensin MukBEF ATPase and DNA-binding subunit MukB